ncbi:MAG: tetratricopeptide repeat protein [Candidatus Symbiobacter sp.]|nr:tetratricopeptide repeat protein [Candidatus Symbiobacter sp.]
MAKNRNKPKVKNQTPYTVPPEKIFQRAVAAYQNHRYAEALRLAEQAKDEPGYRFLAGLCYMELERYEEALTSLQSDLLFRLAENYEIDPALCFALGQAFHANQDALQAEAWYEAALKQKPDYIGARERLIELLCDQHRYGACADHCKIILADHPDKPAISLYFARSLLGLGKTDDALMILRAIMEDHQDIDISIEAFFIFVSRKEVPWDARMEMVDSALKVGAKIRKKLNHRDQLEILPYYYRRGELWREKGNIKAAIDDYKKCLEIDPDDRFGAAAELALLTQAETNQRHAGDATALSEKHVKKIFDEYALRFDQHLLNDLQYRAPSLLAEALAGLPPRPVAVLDLGCGTGLMGKELQDKFASSLRRLDGVDLSPLMLAQAQKTEFYDELHEDNLTRFLADIADHPYDLITAADVLVYIGDLAPILEEIARILPNGGKFAFTVEAAAAGDEYVFQPSHRYAHSLPYLTGLAAQFGFDLVYQARAVLRQDGPIAVTGLVVVLARKIQSTP